MDVIRFDPSMTVLQELKIMENKNSVFFTGKRKQQKHTNYKNESKTLVIDRIKKKTLLNISK